MLEDTAMMRRAIRLLVTFALSLLVVPWSSNAQPPGKVYRIGLFHVGLDHLPPGLEPLRQGLKALGYEEGRNLSLDFRNLPDEAAAYATAREFVRERIDLIVAFENQTIRAAKATAAETPVVFLHASDPVAAGFVSNLAHPGGNLTGFAGFWWDLPGKKLELFTHLVPHLHRVLVLQDPTDPLTPPLLAELRSAGEALHLQLVEHSVTEQTQIERVFGALQPGDVDGAFVVSPTLLVKFPSLFMRLAAEKGLPLPGYRKEWVAQGALFSYASDLHGVGEIAATYVDKILKGTKPGDLPVQMLPKLELVINLKTAQALGLTIPPTVLFQADEVIREVHQEGEAAPSPHPHQQK
jgi:putative tryptophan/tyrosine transport system substrate-binding protein